MIDWIKSEYALWYPMTKVILLQCALFAPLSRNHVEPWQPSRMIKSHVGKFL